MSKASKFLLIFSVLFFIVLLVARILLGGWHDAMWAPFGISIALFIAALFKDRQIIAAFLTMRTTKHGMNMGVLILLALIGVVCINFLAVRYEKTFDWTSEKLNSLSDQSVKAAEGLKQETQIVLLYRQEQEQGENVERTVRTLVSMYSNVSKNIKFIAYNALQRPDLAQKYEFNRGPFAVFAVQGERKVRIDQPTEEEVTKALIKLGRESKKVVYFTTGHGERAMDNREPEGMSILKSDLEIIYDVKPLTLYESENKIPDDADLVAIVGPQQQFLETELKALRDYARNGGRLFIALDPGMRHNLAQVTKSLGVEFANNYILDLRSQVVGGGPSVVLGTQFALDNEVTKAFDANQFTIFNLASSVRKAPDADAGIEVDQLVNTDARTMGIDEIREQVRFAPNGPHTLGVAASGKMASAPNQVDGESKEFSAVIFGDSDFLTNSLIGNNLNRDLVLNAFASLSEDKDLISIRPKSPKGMKLEISENGFYGLVGGWALISIALFFGGGFFWWRRRSA